MGGKSLQSSRVSVDKIVIAMVNTFGEVVHLEIEYVRILEIVSLLTNDDSTSSVAL